MRDLLILLVHLITTTARLMGPGGARSMIAESLLVKHQLLILNRSRQRVPHLRASDRLLAHLTNAVVADDSGSGRRAQRTTLEFLPIRHPHVPVPVGWALGLMGARPAEGKKGADQGIDGRIYFHDGDAGKTKQIVISVKAGKLHAPYVRDLRGVVEREQAALGVLLTLNTPTKAMRTEAASAGFYASPWGQHPRVQILTVEELLAGKKLDAPPPRQTSLTYKRAPKALKKTGEQGDVPLTVEI